MTLCSVIVVVWLDYQCAFFYQVGKVIQRLVAKVNFVNAFVFLNYGASACEWSKLFAEKIEPKQCCGFSGSTNIIA